MWQFKMVFKDPCRTDGGSSTVVLNPNRQVISNATVGVVIWQGWVGSERVRIIETESAEKEAGFVFEVFPAEYEFLKIRIIQWISDYKRRTL